MWRCGLCGKQAAPKTTPTKVILGIRDKVYQCKVRNKDAKPGVRRYIDAVRAGKEIVEEAEVCPSCASQATPTRLSNRTDAPFQLVMKK